MCVCVCVCVCVRNLFRGGVKGGGSKGVLSCLCSDGFLVLWVSCLFVCLGRNPWDGYVVVVAAASVVFN